MRGRHPHPTARISPRREITQVSKSPDADPLPRVLAGIRGLLPGHAAPGGHWQRGRRAQVACEDLWAGGFCGAKGEAHVRPRVLPLSPPLCQLDGSDSSSQGYSGYWTDVLCPISRIATARPDQHPGPSPGALLTRGFEGLERALGSRSQPSHSHTFPLLVHPAGDGLTFTL